MLNVSVSILVPCYNVEKYVRQCLESLVNQTLKEIEIICINDGSTDQTLAILKEYAHQDKRVKIIDKPNSGYGASMNMGLKSAVGEYIGIVESDDFVDLDMFKKLYHLAKKNAVQVVKSNFYIHTAANGDKVEKALPSADLNKVINPRINSDIFYCPHSIWAGIYERRFLNDFEIDFLESAGASYQDIGFSFKVLAQAQRVWLTQEAFLHYRCDNENSSVKSEEKVFCVADEWANIEKYMDKYPQDKKACTILRNHVKLNNYNWNLSRLKGDKKEAFRKIYIKEYSEALMKGLIKKEAFSYREYDIFLQNLYPHSIKIKILIALKKIKRLFLKTKIKNGTKYFFILCGLLKFERPSTVKRPGFYEKYA